MGIIRTSVEVDVVGAGAGLTSVGESDYIGKWAVAGAPSGAYAVAWVDTRGADSISVQVFAKDGTAIGSQFRLPDVNQAIQQDPSITFLTNSTFVVTWLQSKQSGLVIEGQLFSLSSGSPVAIGARFNYDAVVGDKGIGAESNITRLSDSLMLLTGQGVNKQVGQLFSVSPAGAVSRVGAEFTIEGNSSPPGISVALLSPTTFVATWFDQYADDVGANEAVRGQIYAFGNGTPTKVGGEFVVAQTLGSDLGRPVVQVLSAERLVIAYERGDDLTVQLMSISGGSAVKVGEPVSIRFGSVGPGVPAIGVLSPTEFVVFGSGWTAHSITADAGGLRVTGSSIADSNGAGNEQGVLVAQTGPGHFVAVWNDYEIPFSGPNVQGQLVSQSFAFASDGTVDEAPAYTNGPDQFDGRNGNDTILGGAGSDLLRGGEGDDRVFGGAGNDFIEETSGSNYLRGDEGDDQIRGGAGFDDINGNTGNDTAQGGAGDDWVVGGKDNDLLSGEAGADIVYGNLGNDSLSGGDGNDIVRGGQGDDVVRGGSGADFVSGDRGDDTLFGGSGSGWPGGFFTGYGDSAADVFHTFPGAGIDRVMDFEVARDRVMVTADTIYTVSQVGRDTVVEIADGSKMILVDVSVSALPAGWIFGS